MSGSFSEYYGEKNYLVHFDNQRHKIYYPDTVNELYREFQKGFFADMAVKAKDMETLLDQAKKKKLPLMPIQLELPEIVLKDSADIAMVSKTSYPLILTFPIARSEYGGLYHFKFAAATPMKKSDAKWLMEKLKKIVSSEKNTDDLPEKIDVFDYQMPTVSRTYANHALYAGGMFKSQGAAFVYYVEQLQKIIDKVAVVVEKDVARKAFEKEVQVKLIPIADAYKKNSGPEVRDFNSHGPISDNERGVEFFRPRYQNQNMLITTLFASRNNSWGELSNHITALLVKKLVPDSEQLKSFRTDVFLMQLEKGDSNSDSYYSEEKLDKGRLEKALTAYIIQKNNSSGNKSYAIDKLYNLVGKHTLKQTVDNIADYYLSFRDDYSPQIKALQVLGKIPTSESAARLIEIYKVSSTSDSGNPYFLRQEMLTALENIGPTAILPLKKVLADKALQKNEKRVQELTDLVERVSGR